MYIHCIEFTYIFFKNAILLYVTSTADKICCEVMCLVYINIENQI